MVKNNYSLPLFLLLYFYWYFCFLFSSIDLLGTEEYNGVVSSASCYNIDPFPHNASKQIVSYLNPVNDRITIQSFRAVSQYCKKLCDSPFIQIIQTLPLTIKCDIAEDGIEPGIPYDDTEIRPKLFSLIDCVTRYHRTLSVKLTNLPTLPLKNLGGKRISYRSCRLLNPPPFPLSYSPEEFETFKYAPIHTLDLRPDFFRLGEYNTNNARDIKKLLRREMGTQKQPFSFLKKIIFPLNNFDKNCNTYTATFWGKFLQQYYDQLEYIEIENSYCFKRFIYKVNRMKKNIPVIELYIPLLKGFSRSLLIEAMHYMPHSKSIKIDKRFSYFLENTSLPFKISYYVH